eukprot:7901825-Prorocentrum_lima.AAC.1
MESNEEDTKIEISADASFAPGGERSITGVVAVVRLFGVVVHWALSSCEAELISAVTGVKEGLGVRQLLKELLDPE